MARSGVLGLVPRLLRRLFRRKVSGGGAGRGGDNGGGTAGVREPRRPLPTSPSGSGFAKPGPAEVGATSPDPRS